MSDIPLSTDPRVLVDFRTADDAGVYLWEGGPALVQTVDFFTPIVDDPYTYGRIAAANALSDVYAMGGEPRTALAIAAFPKDTLDPADIAAIFRGGYDTLREAGTALLGGHTVADPEIKFGYAVTGAVDPDRILTNAGARPDDVLLLTKPIGTGIIGTAIKKGHAPEEAVAAAIRSMSTLNMAASVVMRRFSGVHACTDVTGFGLIGHSTEVAIGSDVTVEIEGRSVPLLPEVQALAAANRSGGMASNRAYFGDRTKFTDSVTEALRLALFDPQTSGGLLIAMAGDQADELAEAMAASGIAATPIGRIRPASDARVVVR